MGRGELQRRCASIRVAVAWVSAILQQHTQTVCSVVEHCWPHGPCGHLLGILHVAMRHARKQRLERWRRLMPESSGVLHRVGTARNASPALRFDSWARRKHRGAARAPTLECTAQRKVRRRRLLIVATRQSQHQSLQHAVVAVAPVHRRVQNAQEIICLYA